MVDRQIGHFVVTKPLGSGAMGEVFLASDPKLDRQVALKLLPARLCDDEALRQRFLLEARSASAVNHPNVCTIYEVGET
ncbi:MAG: protein kinase, partial [Planctomycetaceae bacterium]|nr:protein kinase [Planctomycetaceae bacterium]